MRVASSKRASTTFLDKDKLDLLLNQILAIEKSARGWCPRCSKAVQVSIPDSRAVASSLSELLTQAKGRPTAEQPDSQSVIVDYRVLLFDTEDGPAVLRSDGSIELPDGSRYVRAKE